MSVRIGISGWTYPPWRGVFFPPGLPHRAELAYAAERLTSIEINGSFYALQRPSSYRSWRSQIPRDFVFAVKAPRFITHMKRLRDTGEALANFFASGPMVLGASLGPVLWQLPPTMRFDETSLRQFVDSLPRSTGEAAYLARRHGDLMTGRNWTGAEHDRPLRHAIEIRHESFRSDAFTRLLRDRSIATVVADTAGKWPMLTSVTADFVYVRLHGAEELYASGYDDDALSEWADRIRSWNADGRDVYVYFDNDMKVRAPFDAMRLIEFLSGTPGVAVPLERSSDVGRPVAVGAVRSLGP